MIGEKSIEEKFDEFLELRKEAINILQKYIEQFSSNPDYKITVEDLKHGLEVLKGGYKRVEGEGIKGLKEDLIKYPKGKRPGIGLSRGFGEFLYALPEEPWIDEIMDAVKRIEEYWRNM